MLKKSPSLLSEGGMLAQEMLCTVSNGGSHMTPSDNSHRLRLETNLF